MADAVSLMIDGNHANPIEVLVESGFALALAMVKNRDDALEIVQESVYVVLKKRSMFRRDRGELRTWFLKIVHNRCIDKLRRKSRSKLEDTVLDQLPAKQEKSPETLIEEKELLELLKKEVMNLPAEHREIILLRDFHGLCYAEIAEVLSIAAGTVMSRLHRARLELQRRMQKYR